MCLFEVFATLFVNIIYLSMLHLSAVESGLSFLAITVFLLAAFFTFAFFSICQWVIEDPLALLASRLFSYQIVQIFLFLFCTISVIRLTMRQDREKTKPLRTFVPYYIITVSFFNNFFHWKYLFLFAVFLGDIVYYHTKSCISPCCSIEGHWGWWSFVRSITCNTIH